MASVQKLICINLWRKIFKLIQPLINTFGIGLLGDCNLVGKCSQTNKFLRAFSTLKLQQSAIRILKKEINFSGWMEKGLQDGGIWAGFWAAKGGGRREKEGISYS